MSFDADNMTMFSRRMQNLFLRIQAVRDEAAKLVEIYVNETTSGADSEFTDTPIASKQEHIDGVTYLLDVAKFHDNEAVTTTDRTQLLTPFLQVD
jgi:hypothetical protein